jgi:ADP-L-glycero-D-manno-heptose 6-epimerase
MILITGGLGFIGSNIINNINKKFFIIEDKQSLKRVNYIKNKNKIIKIIDYKNFDENDLDNYKFSTCIHLGGISNTLEINKNKIKKTNVLFSKKIFNYCKKKNIDFIYASSASVYGNGKYGYYDLSNFKVQKKYRPLNLYGKSKIQFDKFIIKNLNKTKLNKIVGLRFFNVYGINEFHKLGQCSPIYKFFHEIKNNKIPILYTDFKENKSIKRDFIYIDDVIFIIKNILKMKKIKSIINIGTSNPRSFFDVAKIVCKHMNKKEIIIQDIPILIKKNYQYFTCCNNTILKKLKLINNFTSLELGIKKYIHRLNNSPF